MFDIRVEELKSLKKDRELGIRHEIPFDDVYPKLSNYITGIQRKRMYGITAGPGAGKSKLAIYSFVYKAYKYTEDHPETKLDFRCVFFALEDDKRRFIDRIICFKLAEDHGIYISPDYLTSSGKKKLSVEHEKLIEAMTPWMEKFFEKIIIIDDEYNPTGIFKKAKEYCEFWAEKVEIRGTEEANWKHYIAPKNQIVLVVVDYINLISTEKGLNQHQSISKWVSHYGVKQIIKNWGWSILNVIQQTADSERIQFTGTGEKIADKVRPSIAGLGNNKEIARDHDVILGLFDPRRYNITHSAGYNITKMHTYYRQLSVLKNRMGIDHIRSNLFFEGASGIFLELPNKNDKVEQEKWYDKIEKLKNKK